MEEASSRLHHHWFDLNCSIFQSVKWETRSELNLKWLGRSYGTRKGLRWNPLAGASAIEIKDWRTKQNLWIWGLEYAHYYQYNPFVCFGAVLSGLSLMWPTDTRLSSQQCANGPTCWCVRTLIFVPLSGFFCQSVSACSSAHLQGDAGQDGSVWFRAVSQTRIGSIYSPRLHQASLTPSLSVFFSFLPSLIHWSCFWRSSFNPVLPSDNDTSITSCDPHLQTLFAVNSSPAVWPFIPQF